MQPVNAGTAQTTPGKRCRLFFVRVSRVSPGLTSRGNTTVNAVEIAELSDRLDRDAWRRLASFVERIDECTDMPEAWRDNAIATFVREMQGEMTARRAHPPLSGLRAVQ